MRHLTAMALLLFGSAAYASPPDPCSLTSTVKDAQLSIAIPDGRSSFREGEIIPLQLSFTSTADKRYWADDRNYDRSGRLSLEVYCIEPDARDPLADYFRGGLFMGGGLGSTQQLSNAPFTASAELNEWRQPVPGHYRLYVVSFRVWRPPDASENTPYGREAVTLRSNSIEFDITKPDFVWQTKQLENARAVYQAASGDEQRRVARELRFLNTEKSTRALANLFWSLNDQNAGWELMFGIVGSPYRSEAIGSMQREISNPAHPITQEFLQTLTKLQINADPAWDPPTYDPAHQEALQEYWKKRQEHERDQMRAALVPVITALPHKADRAHAVTLHTIAESSELLDAATAAQIRKQLIEEWETLPENTKQELIQYRWFLVAGPDMLPNLRNFVSRRVPPFRTNDAMARDVALRHIYEIDPAEGRSLIVRDLNNLQAQPSLSLVKLLSAGELQPMVKDAVARVEKSDARELDYHLVELFADNSALPGIKAVFNENLGQWACEAQTALLRYFLRVEPEFGVKAVETSLVAREVTGCYHQLLQDLGDDLPRVESIAIKALDDSDPETASDAALSLGKWGTGDAEPALWDRLKRFHKEWQSREAELIEKPPYTDSIGRATALELLLVKSIATGTNWICGPEKFARLSALASPRQRIQIEEWAKLWAQGSSMILTDWFPEDQLSFGVFQYSNLNESQFKSKLSQLPRGTKLYFQIWKPGQMSPPVPMERQQALFEALRDHAAQFGVTIEAKSDP
jgi:hypothetical protein